MEENSTSRFIPYSLIQKDLDGDISDREKLLLESWLSLDEGNRILFEKIRTVSSDLVNLEEYKHIDVDDQWDRFEWRIKDTDPKAVDLTLQTPVKTLWNPLMKFVAAAVILLFSFSLYVNFDRLMGFEVKLFAKMGTERVMLPDSSAMILYKGAEVVFNKRTFNKDRNVVLKRGKALFDVKHQVNNSFVVNLPDNYVRDIGTTFEVSVEADGVEVLVKEGTVALSSGKGEHAKELLLRKNEKGLFTKETALLSKVVFSDSVSSPMLAQKLSYSNLRLDSICADLEKRFQSNITVVGDRLKSRKLSMYFDGQSLSEIVQILSKTLDVKWKANKKGYTIYE